MNKKITTGAVTAIVVAIVVGVAVGGSGGDEANSSEQRATTTANVIIQNAETRDGNAYVTVDGEEKLLAEEIPFDAEGGNFETTKVYRDAVISPNEQFVAFQGSGFERTFAQVYDVKADTFYENQESGDIVEWQDDGKLRVESCGPSSDQCFVKLSVSAERPWEFETISKPEREGGTTYRDNFNAEIDFISNIKAADNLSRFAVLLEDVGPEAIRGTGPFTVFAPNNEAMQNFSVDMTREEKIEFVMNHIDAPIFRYDDFTDGFEAETIGNDTLTFMRNAGTVRVNDIATIVDADIESSNGIIHVIDRTLVSGA